MIWGDLQPGKYGTIVVDPPWPYGVGRPPNPHDDWRAKGYDVDRYKQHDAEALPYSTMTLEEIGAMPVNELGADGGSRVFLWTTNRFVFDAPAILRAWGYEPGTRLFVWCKPPRGTLNITTEFFMVGRRGNPARLPWSNTTWFDWPLPKGKIHSAKPQAFMDLVEAWSEGPYCELFARQPRLGWDHWGKGFE